MTEVAWAPSNAGSVILDLGADVGALILDTPAELAGREIEISPASDGAGARRTHAQVRERRTGAGSGYAAVYPGLPAAGSPRRPGRRVPAHSAGRSRRPRRTAWPGEAG